MVVGRLHSPQIVILAAVATTLLAIVVLGVLTIEKSSHGGLRLWKGVIQRTLLSWRENHGQQDARLQEHSSGGSASRTNLFIWFPASFRQLSARHWRASLGSHQLLETSPRRGSAMHCRPGACFQTPPDLGRDCYLPVPAGSHRPAGTWRTWPWQRVSAQRHCAPQTTCQT